MFLENDTAKAINEDLSQLINKRVGELLKSGSLKDIKQVNRISSERKNQFAKEGVAEHTGVAKLWMGESKTRDLDSFGVDSSEIEASVEISEKTVELALERKFQKILDKTEVDELEEKIEKYFRRSQFAGLSPKESARKVHKVLKTVGQSLRPTESKSIKINFMISKLEHLTA